MMVKTAELAIEEEAIRLKALGTSLQALSFATEEHNLPLCPCQLEGIGKMICELTSTLQGKIEGWKPPQDPKGA